MSTEMEQMSLESILLSKDGFDLFATHLVNEFSIENLAFVFEVMQIKNEAINHRYQCVPFVDFIWCIQDLKFVTD